MVTGLRRPVPGRAPEVAASAGLALSGDWLRGARRPGLSSSFVSSSSVQDAWLVERILAKSFVINVSQPTSNDNTIWIKPARLLTIYASLR
jgi:hypothetical protein